jgi:GT2 family glycosyltransferase
VVEPAPPELTCVVVSFHRPGDLAALLAQVRSPGVQLVVVNVEADEAIVAVAAEHGALHVPTDANIGYAAAVNRGASLAQSELVAFMNDDIQVTPGTLSALASIVRDGSADVAVPRVVDREGETEPTIGPLPTPATLAREWMLLPDHPVPGLRWLHIERWRRPAGVERVDAAAAVLVVARRSTLLEEPLEESYFLYWEEYDWFWRLARRGLTTVYDGRQEVMHHGGRSVLAPYKSRMLARNAVRLVRRTQGRRAAAVAWLVVIVWNARLVVVDLTRFLFGRAGAAAVQARLAGLTESLRSASELA